MTLLTRAAFAAVAGLALLLPPRPAGAQVSDIQTDPDSALQATLGRIEGEPLSLQEAREAVLRNATIAREAEAELRAARGEVRSEKGAFDPELFADIEKEHVERPNTNPFSDDDVFFSEATTTNAGARMRLPIGTELEASLETSRRESNDPFSTLDPIYDTAGKLEVRQPLLKGFGPAARGELTAAERRLEAAEARYRDAVLDVWAQAEAKYWSIYASELNYAVALLVVERAQILVEEAKLRAEAGLVGPNQVANARVFLAQQRLAALDREEELDTFSDELASMMGRRPGSGVSRFRPSDEPPSEYEIEPVEALVARALKQNYRILSAERDLQAARSEARAAGWDALPDLDLLGSVGGTGLAGKTRTDIDTTFFDPSTLRDLDGDFGDTWTQVRKRESPTWSVGLSVSVPIGFREGRGERDRLRAEADRTEQRVIAMRLEVEEEVRARHRELQNGAQRLEIAREGVEAALEQVRIGLIDFENGRATAFEVVRLGADLPPAHQRYSQALVRTATAAAELKRLTSDALSEGDLSKESK